MCNNSEYIRRVIGVTRTFYWTITTGGVEVDLDGRDLRLVIIAAKGGEQVMEFTTDANVLSFVWQGMAQTRIDKYSVVLWENYGEDSQRRVDIHNFVELVPWCAEQSGEYPDLTEETIELGTSDFTDQSGAPVVVVDSLDSHSTTAALSANMGRELNETKQGNITAIAPAYLHNDTLRLRMLAVGNDVMGFVGTQVYPEVTEQSGKDAIMPSIKAIEDHIVTPLQTAINGKQDTIQDIDDIRSGAAAGATAYQLPANGIPATDMASGVQSDLALAASAYQKPSGGIPATDMTTAVQQKLAKADSALQDAPIDNKQYGRLNGAWSEVSIPIDSTPVSGGTNAISSGGVYSALQGVGNMVISAQSGTTLTAAMNTYYTYSSAVTSLAITLPSISSATAVSGFVVNLTTGSSISLTVTAAGGESIKMYSGLTIEASKEYELNFIWNGSEWIVAYGEVVAWGS